MTATAEHRPILNLPNSPLTLAAVEAFRRGRTPVALVPGAKRPSREGWERHRTAMNARSSGSSARCSTGLGSASGSVRGSQT